MKAHNFFAEKKVVGEIRNKMEQYSYLVGKKVKATPMNEGPEDDGLEEELFTIVGLTTKEHTTNIYAVLKSEECDVAVMVDVTIIGRERNTFFYDPGFLLELLG